MHVILGGSLAHRISLCQPGRIEGFGAPCAISDNAFRNWQIPLPSHIV